MIFVFFNFLSNSLCAKVCHNLIVLFLLVIMLNSHQTTSLDQNHTKLKVTLQRLSKTFLNLTEMPIDLSSNQLSLKSNSSKLSTRSHTQTLDIVHQADENDFLKHNFSGHHSSRVKRGIIQLASMIKCVSGCKPIQYKGYGCFCGLFGSGKPVDAIDRSLDVDKSI